MFSKALFKQSMKANWVKWLCVTVATCVMLAIVIIVLGSLAINDIRDSLKGVFTEASQEGFLKENTVDSYDAYTLTVRFADELSDESYDGFISQYGNTLSGLYRVNLAKYASENGIEVGNLTAEDRDIVKNQTIEALLGFAGDNLEGMLGGFGVTVDEVNQLLYVVLLVYDDHPNFVLLQKPNAGDYNLEDPIEKGKYDEALLAYNSNIAEFKGYLKTAYVEYAGMTAYELYIEKGEEEAVASEYAKQAEKLTNDAFSSYAEKASADDFVYDEEMFKDEAKAYVINMIYEGARAKYLPNGEENATEEELNTAEQYGVVAKVLANTALSTYELWLDEYSNTEKYPDLTQAEIKEKARSEAVESITDQIPPDVGEALEELGNMDIYGLIIGSIFYRIAGLLLPLVFVIMVANGLLAGQVDSGSMAYVLSTPTKRRTVAVTQMAYLMLSLFAMFLLVTITSVISIWVVGGNNFAINFAEICFFNLGAFLTAFAFAGYCFMCSAIFNRSKYSMSIGGGLSIFMLVCTILGLFGSNVVPSAMRIDAMNVFNYFSIISLFDTVSILEGTIAFAWKFAILVGISIVTFIIGVFRFEKKDLPL